MQPASFIITFFLLSTVLSPIHCQIQYSFYPIKKAFSLDEHVLFRFTLTNNYDTGLLYLPWGTPLEKYPGELLRITGEQSEVNFICPVASRLSPTADDYKFLPAGSTENVLYNVSVCYTIDTAGEYTANYSRYLPAKLVYAVTAFTSYDSFSSAVLSIDNIRFCVGDTCNLPPIIPELFNVTLISSSSTLLPEYMLIFIYCVVITIMF
ncbi:hypothetical protein LOD99_14117 [Oopsacas minuta]|uniref:Uncharacterized protein n=1 Tax=Oopsacas minuta TaxID=111878 RepID=A0AAV7KI26_9METZ|nr:hypothetical protein LOD99_14117 [Oopsacas minuta]